MADASNNSASRSGQGFTRLFGSNLSSPSASRSSQLQGRNDPAALTAQVRLLATEESRQIIAACLIEAGRRLLLPPHTQNAGLEAAGNEQESFNDIRQDPDLMRIQELKLALADSLEKQQKLQEEARCISASIQEGVREYDAASPRVMLQEALCTVQTALLRCSAMMGRKLRNKGQEAAIHGQLCESFFAGFESLSFGSTQGAAEFQRPDKERKRRLLKEVLNYKGVSEVQLLAWRETCFQAYYESRFNIFVNWMQSPLPFASAKERKSGLAKLLRYEKGDLFPDFASLAKAVWLLHKVAFACEPNAEIFRVHEGSLFDSGYMMELQSPYEDQRKISANPPAPMVSFLAAPGFTFQSSILKAQVYLHRYKM